MFYLFATWNFLDLAPLNLSFVLYIFLELFLLMLKLFLTRSNPYSQMPRCWRHYSAKPWGEFVERGIILLGISRSLGDHWSLLSWYNYFLFCNHCIWFYPIFLSFREIPFIFCNVIYIGQCILIIIYCVIIKEFYQ